MHRIPTLTAACALAMFVGAQSAPKTLEVFYSPKGGCTDAAVAEIAAAKRTILVSAYEFTSQPIADALVEKAKAGINVEVTIDGRAFQSHPDRGKEVKEAGGVVRTDSHHKIHHNKILVIDGTTVVTGSFNWSKSAEESNAENLVIIRNVGIAKKYTDNFRLHAEHSKEQ